MFLPLRLRKTPEAIRCKWCVESQRSQSYAPPEKAFRHPTWGSMCGEFERCGYVHVPTQCALLSKLSIKFIHVRNAKLPLSCDQGFEWKSKTLRFYTHSTRLEFSFTKRKTWNKLKSYNIRLKRNLSISFHKPLQVVRRFRFLGFFFSLSFSRYSNTFLASANQDVC